MLEKEIEKKFRKEIELRNGLCWKFESPSQRGVPDRLIIVPDGRVIFAELKTPSGRLSPVQKYVLGELRKRRVDARVLRGLEETERFVREVFGDV